MTQLSGSGLTINGETRLYVIIGHPVAPVPSADHDTVINATPLGMAPGDPFSVDPAAIDPSMLVVDVIMKPEVTPLLKAAQAKGCRIQPGRHMLDGQVAAVAAFFGIRAV
jgi:shikimate dehydrogenase